MFRPLKSTGNARRLVPRTHGRFSILLAPVRLVYFILWGPGMPVSIFFSFVNPNRTLGYLFFSSFAPLFSLHFLVMDQPWHKPPKQRILPLPQPSNSNNNNNHHHPATHGPTPPPPLASSSPTSSYSGLDWQSIMQLYQNQPELLKMILNSKVEEDKRRTEEAKLRSKELDLYIQETKKRIAAYHQRQHLSNDTSSSNSSRRESTLVADHRPSSTAIDDNTYPILSYHSYQQHPAHASSSGTPVCSSASATASTYIHHHTNASHQK